MTHEEPRLLPPVGPQGQSVEEATPQGQQGGTAGQTEEQCHETEGETMRESGWFPGVMPDELDALTPRERQAYVGMITGMTTREIADTMGCATKTVAAYRYRIYEKLGLDTDARHTKPVDLLRWHVRKMMSAVGIEDASGYVRGYRSALFYVLHPEGKVER